MPLLRANGGGSARLARADNAHVSNGNAASAWRVTRRGHCPILRALAQRFRCSEYARRVPLRRQLGLVTLSSVPGGAAGTRVQPSPALFGYLSRTRAAKDSQRVLAAVQQAPHRSFFTCRGRMNLLTQTLVDGGNHGFTAQLGVRSPTAHYIVGTLTAAKQNAAQPSMVPSNPIGDTVARIHEILRSDATSANASLKGSHWLHS